jgi:hypothetical protein
MSTNNSSNAGTTHTFLRRPQTTFMGAMGLALLGIMTWAFVHEMPSRGAAGPHYARHTSVVRAHG